MLRTTVKTANNLAKLADARASFISRLTFRGSVRLRPTEINIGHRMLALGVADIGRLACDCDLAVSGV